MIKRTLYFGNPAYLSMKNAQILIHNPELLIQDAGKTVPIEDVGVVILDNKQITITQGLLESLLENNVAVITCDSSRLPVGLLLPLCGNATQNERFRNQLNASLPLQKQLWQQTMQCKISNQAAVLGLKKSVDVRNMVRWASSVRSGDPDNYEAQAAVYYWKNMFPDEIFVRDRDGFPPNNLLNYGYAILRAIVARSLVASGLLPTIGIHHHNKYNAYCLADDIMEPYRPYVDSLVLDIVDEGLDYNNLDTNLKKRLLSIPVLDVDIEGERSPLMVAVSQTTASLAKCFSGDTRKILYPMIPMK